MTKTQTLPRLASLDRISKIPVVETGFEYASGAYKKLKKSNSLVTWGLDTVEGRLASVVVNSFPLLELPIGVVDSLVCKTLDEVEQRVPAINYAPEQLMTITKAWWRVRFVQPVLRRADSVKQFSVNNRRLSQYGEMAVCRLDTALDKADVFVEKYLPDSMDGDVKDGDQVDGGSHAKRTIQHANRLSRKLQRRITKRTLAEAQALRKTGNDIVQFVYFSVDLLIKNPREFVNKMLQIWEHLSKDEPENQIPPANLDQLFALVARETARKFVHAMNYSIVVCGNLPHDIALWVNTANHQAIVLLDSLIKTAHLEGIRAAALGRVEVEMNRIVTKMNDIYRLIFESLESTRSVSAMELKPVPSAPQPACQKVPIHQHPRKTKKEKKELLQNTENEKKEPSRNGTTQNHDPQAEVAVS
uniref:Lipid storage droplets surface-binding protein 1 n=1 Tax=Lygus hesperus TaxID=30085 RepID=A0A0K8SS19_LYGHE